jgi:hypothetical protein
MISPLEMDFYTGSRDEEETEELPPKNQLERFWRCVCTRQARTTEIDIARAAGSCESGRLANRG